MTTETALKPSGVITTPGEYTASLSRWQGSKYNVLTPFANVTGLAAQHGLIASMVQIDVRKEKNEASGKQEFVAGEVYDGLPFLKNGEVAISKNGLRKLAECGGISTRTERTDPRTIRYYWEIKCIASYRSIDGSIVTREASQEWDLRDGSDRMKGWTPAQIQEARKHGLRACETRAVNAAIRECGCGIKQKYSLAELAKPFVVIRVAFQPDMSDPDVKRLVTENALRGTSTLYPSAGRELPASHDVDEGEVENPKTVGASSTAAAAQQPAVPTHGPLQKCEPKDIPRRDKTGTFKKWIVIDSNGVEHVTIKREFGEALEQLFKDKRPVEIVSQENSYQENEIEEITPIDTAQSSLPLGVEMKL